MTDETINIVLELYKRLNSLTGGPLPDDRTLRIFREQIWLTVQQITGEYHQPPPLSFPDLTTYEKEQWLIHTTALLSSLLRYHGDGLMAVIAVGIQREFERFLTR